MHGAIYPLTIVVNGVSFAVDHWNLIPSIYIPLAPVFGVTAAGCLMSSGWRAWRQRNAELQNKLLAEQIEAIRLRLIAVEKINAEYTKNASVQGEIARLESELAQAHAICDATRTSILNPKLLDSDELLTAITVAITTNNGNIRECLRVLCLILELMCGEPVAASIKTIVKWGKGVRQLDGAKSQNSLS